MKDFILNNYPTILLSLFSLSFAIYFYSSQYKIRSVEKRFAKLFADYQNLQRIFKDNNEFKSDSDSHKENFIKFLSDSRDWAFEYIDDVQKSINEIIEKTESTVEYHKKFGSLEIEPYATHITVLADAVEELKTLLPNKDK
jgi:hypothetical protein